LNNYNHLIGPYQKLISSKNVKSAQSVFSKMALYTKEIG